MKEQLEPTSDALEIMRRMFIGGNPERVLELQKAISNANVAQQIYDLRTKAGLTQRALAKLVGTTASAICRLEDSDYEGHSMTMLHRIAAALGKRVEIRFVSLPKKIKIPSGPKE